MNVKKISVIVLLGVSLSVQAQTRILSEFVDTKVVLNTSDAFLDSLYRAAERVCKGNETDFLGLPVLVEGGGYEFIWPETQPMGGEMYAKRNLKVAANNTLFFLEYQHPFGRYPGHIECKHGVLLQTGSPNALEAVYTHMQGFCFPYHALNIYYWNKKRDKEYLKALYQSFELFDNYLWKYRDSDGNGCLETWCLGDTGEDHSTRFPGIKSWFWPGEVAPTDDPVFPVESMDMMSYSYDARITLAKISALLGNGLEKKWKAKAKIVQDKIQSYLWDDAKGACYDRNCRNEVMPELIHNNLRAMYFGSFTQQMADRFVKEHLMNPEEFFTPFPLVSIAVNDPLFRNITYNNWCGQPEGLTYQRAIRALENYGHFSEITLFGEKLINNVGKRNIFPQQFDPFTGEFSEPEWRTSYGPTALSVLEYISRFYGVHVQFDDIYWGALGRGKHEINYTQHWDGDAFSVQTKDGKTTGSINGKEIFRVSNGVRVVTNWKGRVKKIINIKDIPLEVHYSVAGKERSIPLKPNQVFSF